MQYKYLNLLCYTPTVPEKFYLSLGRLRYRLNAADFSWFRWFEKTEYIWISLRLYFLTAPMFAILIR